MPLGLIAVTTFNQLGFTKKCFKSIEGNSFISDNFNITIYDDFSTDGTKEFCKKNDIHFVTTDKPRGVTYSWNQAYKRFQQNNYKYLFIVNNDILIPPGSVENLCNWLDKYSLVTPMSSSKGVGHSKGQSVHKYAPIEDSYAHNPLNYIEIQTKVQEINKGKEPRELNHFSGFFFGLNKSIKKAEYQKGILFNPANIMIHQEGDLKWRLKRNKMLPVVCLQSFVYHFKGRSTAGARKKGKQDLTFYHKEYYAHTNNDSVEKA